MGPVTVEGRPARVSIPRRVGRILAVRWRRVGDAKAYTLVPWLVRLGGISVVLSEALSSSLEPAVLALGAFLMVGAEFVDAGLDRYYAKGREYDAEATWLKARPRTIAVGSREFYEQRAITLLRDPDADFDGLDFELATDWIAKGGRLGLAGEHLNPEPSVGRRGARGGRVRFKSLDRPDDVARHLR